MRIELTALTVDGCQVKFYSKSINQYELLCFGGCLDLQWKLFDGSY